MAGMKTHRMSDTRTYKSWQAMHGRCRGHGSDPRFYVDKGIKVCAEWATFQVFLADMGERPEGMTLDRKDGSKDYGPSNCRWATFAEQVRNRSSNILLTYRGETKCLKDWAHELGINYGTTIGRFKRGLPVDLVLSTTKLHHRSGRWAGGVVRA